MTEELAIIDGITIYRTKPKVLPSNKTLKNKARELRKAGVLSEVLFWMQVRNGNFYGIDFDRQRVIGNYIVDFYVKSLDLVIEIGEDCIDEKDGDILRKQRYFEGLDLKVYRFSDEDIKNNLGRAMEIFKNYIKSNFSTSLL